MGNSLFGSALLAQTQTQTVEDPGPPPEKPSSFGFEFFLVIAIFFIAFFFLIQRPQRKAQEEKLKAIETMKKGDKVVSIGGIHGSVVKVNKEKNTVVVQVAKGVEMEFNKGAVNVQVEEEKKDEKAKS